MLTAKEKKSILDSYADSRENFQSEEARKSLYGNIHESFR